MVLWYILPAKAKRGHPQIAAADRFPAQERRVALVATTLLRTWDASDESLRNFTGTTHDKDNCPRNAVSPPSVCLSGLSQAPHPMHRRRFPFPAFSGVCQGASPRRTRKGCAVG